MTIQTTSDWDLVSNFKLDTVEPKFDGDGVYLEISLTNSNDDFILFNAYYDDIDNIKSSLDLDRNTMIDLISDSQWQSWLK